MSDSLPSSVSVPGTSFNRSSAVMAASNSIVRRTSFPRRKPEGPLAAPSGERLRQPPVPRRTRKVEPHDQVVEVVVATAGEVFPTPGVQPVVPQVPDVLAVHHFVGLGERRIGVARAVVG